MLIRSGYDDRQRDSTFVYENMTPGSIFFPDQWDLDQLIPEQLALLSWSRQYSAISKRSLPYHRILQALFSIISISKRQTVRGKSALAFPVYHFFGILKSFFCSKRKIFAATHLRFENSAFRIFSAKRFGNLSSKEFLFTKPARRATAFLVEKGGKIERIVES